MRLSSLNNLWFIVILSVMLSAVDGYAGARHQTWGDWLAVAFFGSFAAYCAVNFLQCREFHCAITAPGFIAAAVLMVFRAIGVAQYEYGLPWFVFAASACVGFCAEWVYKARTGSVFLK
ncbi:MAG: hypothetical protein GIW99_01335 [Candidatus Eremiobacteraeota bacterium]|nr:hypothetical protein [Candidatus Eremiobacteraeota bacterium]